MPTLPLYTPNPVADASHRVIAPGGYEWWHFDAESDGGDLYFTARLGGGFGSDPTYLTRYRKYLARPTRYPPPVPDNYPSALVAVFDRKQLLEGFEVRPPPQEYAASDDRPEVRAGANHFITAANGSIELDLEGREAAMSVKLEFRPLLRHAPYQTKRLKQPNASSEHYWFLAQPLCKVTGSIRLPRARHITFSGRGYHDHCFGTAPMGTCAWRCLSGRVLLHDRVIAFQVVDPERSGRAPLAHAVEADEAGVRELSVTHVGRTWPGRAPSEVEWPQELRLSFDGREELRLYDGSGVDFALERQHVVYRGTVGPVTGGAVCAVEYHGGPSTY